MALVSLLWGLVVVPRVRFYDFSLHAQYALESFPSMKLAFFPTEAIVWVFSVGEGVFRLTECHGPLVAPCRCAGCVQLSHSVGTLGWQRGAQLARAQTARCCSALSGISPIRLLFSHDCQIHSQ